MSEDVTLPKIKDKEKEYNNQKTVIDANADKKKMMKYYNKNDKLNKDKQEEIAPFIPSGSNFE